MMGLNLFPCICIRHEQQDYNETMSGISRVKCPLVSYFRPAGVAADFNVYICFLSFR